MIGYLISLEEEEEKGFGKFYYISINKEKGMFFPPNPPSYHCIFAKNSRDYIFVCRLARLLEAPVQTQARDVPFTMDVSFVSFFPLSPNE
jgi:hypothetical protein